MSIKEIEVPVTHAGLPVWLVNAFAPTDHDTTMWLGIHVAAVDEENAKRIAMAFWKVDADRDGDWSFDEISDLNTFPATESIVYEEAS